MSVERIRRMYNPSITRPQQEIGFNKIHNEPIVIKKNVGSGGLIDNHVEYDMKPILISYYADYTENKYYKGYADALIERCKSFGISFDISEMESRDSYGSNCLMKPEFILKKLTEIKKPIIWMDCDTDFVEPFTNFNDITQDIGMATHTGDLEGIKASPLYFSYSKGSFLIIREWVLHCRSAYDKNIIELDHDSLKHYVLKVLEGKFTYYLLSDNWIDFVNGRYIKNGNSSVDGKHYFHRNVKKFNDPARFTYTSDIKTLSIFIDGIDSKSFIDGYNILMGLSNFCRFEFVFRTNLIELKDCDEFKKLDIETGGMISFQYDKYDNYLYDSDNIYVKFFNIAEIENNWDTKLLKLLNDEMKPISLFKESKVEIKYNNLKWN